MSFFIGQCNVCMNEIILEAGSKAINCKIIIWIFHLDYQSLISELWDRRIRKMSESLKIDKLVIVTLNQIDEWWSSCRWPKRSLLVSPVSIVVKVVDEEKSTFIVIYISHLLANHILLNTHSLGPSRRIKLICNSKLTIPSVRVENRV